MKTPVLLAVWLLASAFVIDLHAADSKLRLSKEPMKKELSAVVESQLAAFRTNDYARAYTFAASSIKQQFPLEQFRDMVKKGYPSIANSKSATFGIILDDGEQAVVNVTVKGADDKPLRYEYLLILEDGKWHINGVIQKPPDGESA